VAARHRNRISNRASLTAANTILRLSAAASTIGSGWPRVLPCYPPRDDTFIKSLSTLDRQFRLAHADTGCKMNAPLMRCRLEESAILIALHCEKPDLCGLRSRIVPAPFLFNFLGYSHTLDADIIDWFKGAGQRRSAASGVTECRRRDHFSR